MQKPRRDRKAERQKQSDFKYRVQFDRMFNILNLDPIFREDIFRRVLLRCHYPRPTVHLAKNEVSSEDTETLITNLEQVLSLAKFECPVLGEVSLVDYFSTIAPFVQIINRLTTPDLELLPVINETKERLREICSEDTAALATMLLHRKLDAEIIKVGRIDSRNFYIIVDFGRNEYGKWFLHFFLHSIESEPKSVRSSGEVRRAFRCGQPYGLEGMDWVTWSIPASDSLSEFSPLPVYVQSHALKRLYYRLAFISDGEWMVHDHLWSSLRDEKNRKPGDKDGTYLVDFILFGHKVGYLVAEHLKAEQIILVRTFLFVTMEGTPEHQLLRERLKLQRPDVIHLELDRIQTFLMTDLRKDRELVEILTECGCGRLFAMLADSEHIPTREGYAKDTRKYLGMLALP
jgi:hypothetical protein